MRRFRLRYAGGCGAIIIITLLSLTGVLIPLAVMLLIGDIEILELPPEPQMG